MSIEEALLRNKLQKEIKKNEELRKENERMKRKIEKIEEIVIKD